MNIYAIKGHKVKYVGINNFSRITVIIELSDYQKNALKYLIYDKTYTVEKTNVYNWYTEVYLQEFPEISFNSVHFKDVIEQTEERNKLHKDYTYFHD